MATATRASTAATSATTFAFKNWGGNQRCSPLALHKPSTEDELVALVQAAADAGEHVKVVGAGHSFTDIACTDGHMISLDNYRRVLEVDIAAATIKVQAGITIHDLGEVLAGQGLAQPNLGDIAYQSIAGAISTATHGTGQRLGNIATQVKALSLVTADGSIVDCSAEKNANVFNAARVGLGALGVISTVTLQCVPAFVLRSVQKPRVLDEVLEQIDELTSDNQHFEFFWIPHSDRVLAIANNPMDSPPNPPGPISAYFNDMLLENHAFGLLQRLGRANPRWIPPLGRFTASLLSSRTVVDSSRRVFANERLVRFVEMEYALPREVLAPAVREVRSMIDAKGLRISFPIEVRVAAGDDIWLSTASGRDTCYVAVHVFQGLPFDGYFHEVEAIMNGFNGRPHWGKMHYHSAATLRPRYAHWDDFIDVRNRLDPDGRFSNAYLDRVLGKPQTSPSP
jgi:L-gulono-1,4-lactone dehydrogenase